MAICCVVRPPHHLGGVAKSRSLFVATPPSSLVVAAYTQYASLLGISGALHIGIFEQPEGNHFFRDL